MASTGVAIALKADPDHVRSGLYGYNGCLVAIGGPQFLGSSATLLALVLLAAGASSALLLLFRRQNAVTLPALTIPFVLCSWLLILSLRAANPAGPATGGQRNVPVPISGLPADWSLIEATLNGIAQVYLQSGIIAGLLVALALLAGSRQAFLVACAAGFSSAAVASLIGVPELAIRSGLFGFNAVLAALALGVVYLRPGRTALVVAISAAAIMPVFQTFCALALVPLGLPTMSLPFIAATWLALFALRPLARPAT